MWFRKSSPRRQAIRDDLAESLSQAPQKRYGAPVAVSLLFFVIATLIVFYPRQNVPYQKGDTPSQSLRARVAFSTEDPEKRKETQNERRRTAPPVVVLDPKIAMEIEQQLDVLKVNARSMPEGAEIKPEMLKEFPGLDTEGIKAFKEMEKPEVYDRAVMALMARLKTTSPLVDGKTAEQLALKSVNSGGVVALSTKEGFDSKAIYETKWSRLVTLGDGERISAIVKDQSLPIALWKPITGYLQNLQKPLFTFDAAQTASYANHLAESAPSVSMHFEPNAEIVKAGDVIDDAKLAQLRAAQEAYDQEQTKANPWRNWYSNLGLAIAVGVLTVAATLYVTRMNPQSNTAGRGWAVCGLMLVTLFIAKNAAVILPQARFLVGVAPTLLATIILIIVFNPRFALAIASIHGLLVTLALNQSLDFFLAMMTGIAIFAFGLREIRTRAKLIEVGVFAAIGLFVAVWALHLARMTGSIWSPNLQMPEMTTLSRDSLQAAGAGVLVGFITLGILPFIERVFKMTTSMTLLELCDANRPLLRRLAQEAPGTFNHSLTVGIMAEAAADAIGVNGLLCRAGAYYHDVGKLSKPQYFIENQAGGPNRHDKLSPAMSLLIIVGHVKDGVELAREYGLPWSLHQFIAQHHGTTLVEYFYHAARKRQEEDGDTPEVRETEFRYPGPKPQTKEVAILMICDGVESVVRSIPDKSPGRIETAVHGLIMKRLLDGQFSECDLTLRELSQIEAALTKALAGIYHGRVQYPATLGIAAQTA